MTGTPDGSRTVIHHKILWKYYNTAMMATWWVEIESGRADQTRNKQLHITTPSQSLNHGYILGSPSDFLWHHTLTALNNAIFCSLIMAIHASCFKCTLWIKNHWINQYYRFHAHGTALEGPNCSMNQFSLNQMQHAENGLTYPVIHREFIVHIVSMYDLFLTVYVLHSDCLRSQAKQKVQGIFYS